MKITWLGHSAFRLEESTGTTVVTDPYHPYVGFEMPKVRADIVTLSHMHNDHSYIQAIEGEPVVLKAQGAFEVGGVHILAQRTYHDESKGSVRGENIIFSFRMDGVNICHMGDIGEECNAMLVETIAPVNVLMIPVGGGAFTINAEQAKEYVDRIMPDVVIPMHFKTRDCEFDLDKISDFLDLFDDDSIVYYDGDTIEFDRADFDGEKTKVLVLQKFSN